jgi:glyoxylase-like metal-dependent hydrolase (beta-lactamase superfamily II)
MAIALTPDVPTSSPTIVSAGMDVRELAPGLWRWTAFHHEWKDTVGSIYYEAADAVVLIDPLVPVDEAARFWEALDRDLGRAAKPLHVLVTVFWHVRSTREIVERRRARIWAPTRGRAAIERRAGTVTDLFRPGDRLPGGIQAFASGRATEVVFWLPEHRAVVPGDVILGDEGGGLRLCPESWLPSGVRQARVAEALRPLLELPVERVLVSHGEPVLADGRDTLARALAQAQSSAATAT